MSLNLAKAGSTPFAKSACIDLRSKSPQVPQVPPPALFTDSYANGPVLEHASASSFLHTLHRINSRSGIAGMTDDARRMSTVRISLLNAAPSDPSTSRRSRGLMQRV